MKRWNRSERIWKVYIWAKGIPKLKGVRIYLGEFRNKNNADLAYELASGVYHR